MFIHNLNLKHVLKEINETPVKEVNDVTLKILDSFSNNKFLGNESLADKIIENNDVVLLNNIEMLKADLKPRNANENESHVDTKTANPTQQNEVEQLLNSNNNPNIANNNTNNINTKEIKEFKSFFLQILWKYCSEIAFYDGLNANLLNRSRKIFCSILLKPPFKEELAKYVKNCIMNISLYHLLSTNLTVSFEFC